MTSNTYPSTVAALFAAYPNPPLATIENQYPIANYISDGMAAAPGEAVAAIVTHSVFACTARTADQLLAKYVPVWAYEFKDTNAPELFNLPTVFPYGAAHASELQFIFDPNGFFPNIDYQIPTDPFSLSPAEEGLSREWSGIGRILSRRSTPTAPQGSANVSHRMERRALWRGLAAL